MRPKSRPLYPGLWLLGYWDYRLLFFDSLPEGLPRPSCGGTTGLFVLRLYDHTEDPC